MNSNVEANKKYIREQIAPHEQAQFYNYFLSLPDSQLFQTWTVERTAEAVRNFKHQQHSSPPPEQQQETIEELQERYSSPVKSVEVEVKPIQGASRGSSSLNLLEEIEKKAIRASESGKKSEHKEEKWLNISNFSQFLTNSDPSKFNPDLFRNFDTIITKHPDLPNKQEPSTKQEPPSQQELPTNKSPQRMSMPVISTKKEDKRRKLQGTENESIRSSGEKERKDGQKDKLFRLKLMQRIACKKLDGEQAASGIEITHHEMVHRIFLPDYAMYWMQVQQPAPAPTLTCKRTYDDFVLLRNTLQYLYPYVRTPYLQSGSWLSENDIALIKKNKTHLQLFMRSLIRHPLLSRLPVVIAFLTIPEHKQIKGHLEAIKDKAVSPRGLGEVCSSEGIVAVELSSEQYELVQELPRWENMFSDYFQKYSDLLSALGGQLEAVEQTYSQLLKLNSEMQAALHQLTDRNTQIERQQDFEEFFRRQEEFYAERKRQNDAQLAAITDTLIPLAKYERLNIIQFRSDFESAQKLTEKYLKRLENQPESPRSAEDIATIVANNRLGEDLWKESENMQFFKVQLGFLHTSLLRQAHLFSSRLIDTLSLTWQQLYGGPKKNKGEGERMSIRSCS